MLRHNLADSFYRCLENPRPIGADPSLTEDLISPFQTESIQWHGRYYIDVAGSTTRARKSVAIGRCDEMTKPEAKRKLSVMLHELGVNDNSYLEKALTPVKLFSEQAEWWEANVLPMHKPSSQNSSHYILKKHLIPYFGQMAMDARSEGTVQEWISGLKLQGTLGPKKIANMWKVLKLIIGKPTREWTVRLPEIPETEQRYFTPKETEQLIEAAEGQYKALFALRFATGMRFGEIAGLHVEDLDFSELIVYIRRSTFIHQEVATKTKAGHREVDVDAGTMAILKSAGTPKIARVRSIASLSLAFPGLERCERPSNAPCRA